MTTVILSVREFYEFRRIALPRAIDFSFSVEGSDTVLVEAPSPVMEELGF